MKALFLNRPADWTRTQRTTSDTAREACAIERPAPNLLSEFYLASAIVVVLGFIGLAIVFFPGVVL